MKCADLKKFLYPFVDNELSVEQNLEVIEHLNMCCRCAREVEAEKEFKGAVRRSINGRCATEHFKLALRQCVADSHDIKRVAVLRHAALAMAAIVICALMLYAAYHFHLLGHSAPSGPFLAVAEQQAVDHMVQAFQRVGHNAVDQWKPVANFDDIERFFSGYIDKNMLHQPLCLPRSNGSFACGGYGLYNEEGVSLPLVSFKNDTDKYALFTCFMADSMDFSKVGSCCDSRTKKGGWEISCRDGVCVLVWKCHMEKCYHCIISNMPEEELEALVSSFSYAALEKR